MLTLESVGGCPASPRIYFALEELGMPYAVVRRDDGHFYATYGRTGPRLVDGAFSLFEGAAILRHVGRLGGGGRLVPDALEPLAEMDAWIDFAILRIGLPIGRLVGARLAPQGARDAKLVARETASLARSMPVLERATNGRDFLVGEALTLADVAVLPVLAIMAQRAGVDLSPYPAVRAYAERLGARPAWHRALARAQSV